MALIIKDRVKETTTTTGTGTVTLAGASTGFRSFADIGNANTTYYTIVGGSEWEVGVGTYTASGTTLSRDTVLSNSLGTTALISFSAGSKDVFVTYPSSQAVIGYPSAGIPNSTGSAWGTSYDVTGTNRVVLNTSPMLSGNVGIGLTGSTPIAWTSLYNSLQVGSSGAISNPVTGSEMSVSSNLKYQTTYKYVNNGAATRFYQTAGVYYWDVDSGSQTANTSALMTNVMNLNQYGDLTVTGSVSGQNSYFDTVNPLTGALQINTTGAGDTIIGATGTGYTTTLADDTVNLTNTVNVTNFLNVQGTLYSQGTLNLQSYFSANNLIATAQTSGNLDIGGTTANSVSGNTTLVSGQSTGTITIGGTSATGAINIGRSTGAQAINIGNGAASTSTVGIGGTGLSTGTINIGRSTGSYTLAIGSGNTANSQTRAITIGTGAAGTGISTVTIGKYSTSAACTTAINGNAINFTANTLAMTSNSTASLYGGTSLALQGSSTVDINGTSLGATNIGSSGDTQTLTVNHSYTQINSIATNITSLTASQAVFTDASKNLVSKATTGSGSVVLSSSSAPSGAIVGISDTQTLTNKRITSRASTTTSSATPTINTDNTDIFGLTAQAVDITSFTTNLSGTPTDGQKLWIYIVGTAARAITWGASFESSTATLPTTTVTTNRLDVGFVWNVATSKWRCIAVA